MPHTSPNGVPRERKGSIEAAAFDERPGYFDERQRWTSRPAPRSRSGMHLGCPEAGDSILRHRVRFATLTEGVLHWLFASLATISLVVVRSNQPRQQANDDADTTTNSILSG